MVVDALKGPQTENKRRKRENLQNCCHERLTVTMSTNSLNLIRENS